MPRPNTVVQINITNTHPHRRKESRVSEAQIKKAIAAFLDKGGKIQHIPTGVGTPFGPKTRFNNKETKGKQNAAQLQTGTGTGDQAG